MINRIFQLVLLATVLLGISACGLQFGSAARKAVAAEKARQAQQARIEKAFSTTPNTKQAAKSKNTDKQQKTGLQVNKMDAQGKAGLSVYVRVGKPRQRRRVHRIGKTVVEKDRHIKKQQQDKKSRVKKPRRRQKKVVLYPGIQLFGARLIESSWKVTRQSNECNMTQQIPRYGKVVFSQNPVSPLFFAVHVIRPVARVLKPEDKRYQSPLFTDRYPYPDVGAKLESVPPNWKPFSVKKVLGMIPMQTGYIPFILPHGKRIPVSKIEKIPTNHNKVAKQAVQVASKINYLPEIWPDRLMAELEDGMGLRLTYRDWADATQDIITTISPVNINDVIEKFNKCIWKLPKYHFEKYRLTRLYYNKGQRNLSKKAKKQLHNMVSFIRYDTSIKRIKVVAYTDSLGFKRINRNVARGRANTVKKYLKKLGLPFPIKAIGAGEEKFVGSNRTAAGRAKNRRVEITLFK